MAYDSINDAAKALFNSISTAAKDATFTTASSTEALMEGAALIKAAKVVGDLISMIPEETHLQSTRWIRPVEWLPMPEMTQADDLFAGLFAVYPEGNLLALSATGNYTVDWGDGTIENFATGATAEHEYDFASIVGTPYMGYKQVMVKVYGQVGSDLTTVNLCRKHSKMASYTGIPRVPFLDIKCYGHKLVMLYLEHPTPTTTRTISLSHLQNLELSFYTGGNFGYALYNNDSIRRVKLVNCRMQGLTYAFQNCDKLSELFVDLIDCPYLDYAFDGCRSLRFVDAFNVAGGYTATYAFRSCSALYHFPNFSTDNGAYTFSYMFTDSGLIETPNIQSLGSVNASNMFASCKNLVIAKGFDFANCTTYASMFANCSALSYVYPILLKNASVLDMFTGCANLKSPPVTTVTSGMSLSGYLRSSGIEWFDDSVHLVALGSISSMQSMLSSCAQLKSLKLSSLYGATDISQLCSSSTSLVELILPNINAISSLTGTVPTSANLKLVRMPGAKETFSVSQNTLNADALNQLFDDLASGVTAKTITVTGNYGISEPGYNPSIATAKGWTVTA